MPVEWRDRTPGPRQPSAWKPLHPAVKVALIGALATSAAFVLLLVFAGLAAYAQFVVKL